MDKFIRGQIKVLVATSIVEVGIDAKDATVIVIENAERFGLAQLHQLRGRVGRGHKQSYCILISDTDQELALERLSTIVSTTNGFEIAERDLELRGPGDLYGIKQHGILDLKIADPIKDSKLFALASEHAQLVVSNISKEEYKKVLEESLAKNMTKDIVTS
jgi:ATP-dependent DNA helicase RecG